MRKSRLIYLIHNELGDTLVEALVAVLISALSLLMLATATGVATRLVTTSRENLDNHYKVTNHLTESSASSDAGATVNQEVGKVTFIIGSDEVAPKLVVNINSNDSFGGIEVISYEVPEETS